MLLGFQFELLGDYLKLYLEMDNPISQDEKVVYKFIAKSISSH